VKKFKVKKCKWCSKDYTQYRPLFPYCSFDCANKDQASKKKNKVVKPPTKTKQVSKKRKEETDEYSLARKEFLFKPENEFCIVMATMHGKTVRCTEVHHKYGRENERLLDQEYWLAVSRKGHQWIHANPKLAREAGWLI
jgi:hypothetical protein